MRTLTKILLLLCVALTISVQAGTPDQYLELIQKLFESGDQKVIADMGEFFSETVTCHDGGSIESQDYSLDEITQIESDRASTLSGKKFELLNTFVAEDVIVCYLNWHGVQLKEYMGLPATNKEFTLPVVLIYRFSDDKISEVWSSWDRLSLLEQLGDVHVEPKPEDTV